jgi:hypothetical protein
MGLATTAADERKKNRSKEITITLMDALISILALRDACKLLIPSLSLYIYCVFSLFSTIIQINFVEELHVQFK